MFSANKRLMRFFFAEQSDGWLTILRIGFGLQTAAYCWSLRGDWIYLLAGDGRGLISRDLGEAILSSESTIVPRLGWFVSLGRLVGASEDAILSVIWWCLFIASICLVIGLFSRTAAVASWCLHLA